MSVAREWSRFLSALQFLTVLPVGASDWEVDRMARAAAYFPAVGLVVGGLGAGVLLLLDDALGLLAAGLAVMAMMLVTGGLHEDGMADTADGLGARRDRERTLDIMGDSRIGAHGAAALVFSVGLRWAALATMPASAGALALLVAATVGRALMVPVPIFSRYAREEGLGQTTEEAGPRECGIALGTAGFVAALGGGGGLLALLAAGVAAAVMLAIVRRRIGGYTGDVLGALCQVGEITALIVLAAMWGRP